MAAQEQQQRYRVIERIAAGGMAEVYRAESAGLEGFKKTVAIKRVLPQLSEKKQFIGMFLDEARLSAQLNHSNCVQVFDIGVGDNTYFIVMEFVDGSDLKAIVEHLFAQKRTFPVPAALHICSRICEGLSYAHEARDERGRLLGIVHRDISPPNVLITRYGEVKVVDFGLAKANSQLEHSQPGIIKGKFGYLSPEAALGESVDLRTDIFAVGIILWELLAGKRLFLGESDLGTVRLVQAAKIPDIRKLNPEVSDELFALLNRALARDPRERYQSARELVEDLNRILFQLGKPVSSFDVASLVDEVVSVRKRAHAKRARMSVIGTLIEDAMMEFTSLKPGNSANIQTLHSTTSSLASQPLDALPDASDWPSNFGMSSSGVASAPLRARTGSYSAGNLAALEEDAPGVSLASLEPPAVAPKSQPSAGAGLPPPGSAPHQVESPSAATASPPQQAGPPAPEQSLVAAKLTAHTEASPTTKKGPGGAVAIILVLVAAAGAAGAYLSGMIQ